MSTRAQERRAYGTGGVTYDRSRDRWVGTIETGRTSTGGRGRKKVSARTREEVEDLLALAQDPATATPTHDGRAIYLAQARAIATHTPQEWVAKKHAYRGLCHYCGRPWGMTPHKEHATEAEFRSWAEGRRLLRSTAEGLRLPVLDELVGPADVRPLGACS